MKRRSDEREVEFTIEEVLTMIGIIRLLPYEHPLPPKAWTHKAIALIAKAKSIPASCDVSVVR